MLLAESTLRSGVQDEALGGSLPSTTAEERPENGIPEEKGPLPGHPSFWAEKGFREVDTE